MADRNNPQRRPPRAPVRATTRRRWLVIGGVSGLWFLLLFGTGSAVMATIMLVLLLMLVGACVVGLRCLGIDRDHPWVQQMATRPWRDGRDVLQQALRHLPELFIVAPSGSLLAPNAVELRMNPDDLAALTGMMDLDLVSSSAAEVYQGHIAELGARLGSDGPVEVRVAGDPAVPAGRFQLRQGRPVRGAYPGSMVPAGVARASVAPSTAHRAPFNAHDGQTRGERGGVRTMATDLLTVTEAPSIPLLRLVTNGSVVQTRMSGARAGRDGSAELVLPAEPTVSRVHAKFDFTGGQWWITGLGRNGVTLNGVPLAGESAVHDGDCVLWGRGAGALMSRVEIG
jgi:hypothetical protein